MYGHTSSRRRLRGVLGALLVVGLALALAPSARAALYLGAPQLYSTVLYSDAVAIGDFDEDGHPDVAVARGLPSFRGIEIMRGSATGLLSAPDVIDVERDVRDVAVGDFDDDGHLDLAVADGSDDAISIYYGAGDGTFSAGPVIADAGTPVAITAVDLNHDGRDDVATANTTNADMGVALAGPGRTFGSVALTQVGLGPTAIASADLHGNGSPDLLVVNGAQNTLRQENNNGSGGFSGGSYGTDAGPLGVAAGDFNHDGRTDAVTAGGDTVSQLLHAVTTGLLDIHSSFPLPAGATANAVAAGELTSDDFDDAITANAGTGTISLLAGSAGELTSPQTYAAGPNPSDVAIGDLNGDGLADVVVATNGSSGLAVLFGHARRRSPSTCPRRPPTATAPAAAWRWPAPRRAPAAR